MYTSADDRHKYAIVFSTRLPIPVPIKIKADGGFLILINQQPIYDFGRDVIVCSQLIDMDLHLIKNVKSPVNKLDAVNKGFVDRIKYKTAAGIIPNTVRTDHALFTFPAGKVFECENIIICEMWIERLADEWIATSSQMFATE